VRGELSGLLFAAYRLRLHEVQQQFNARLEGHVAERTRIARDLHDTLLQSVQGVVLKLQAVTYILDRSAEARETLQAVVEQVSQAVAEARNTVLDMRSSTLVTNNLPRALSMLGEGLADQSSDGNPPEFRLEVVGTTRDLQPLIRDEVYRIASEALRNAFKHSLAQRIEAEVRYDPKQLQITIRDNGKGIDPKVLEEGRRISHYGLTGMKERAQLVGGKLTVWSKLGAGTETELTIPASVAYAKLPAARWPRFWRKGA